MKEISTATAISFFRRDRYRYFGALATLSQNMPPIPRRLFADGDEPGAVMMVEEFPHGICAGISGSGSRFLAESIDWLRDSCEELLLSVEDKRIFHIRTLMQAFRGGPIGCVRSFVCTDLGRVPEMSGGIARLTWDDRSAMERYEYESSVQGPSLVQVFQWQVIDRGGVIYAVKDGDEIVAYLSCSREYENIWDLDFIHVQPSRRQRGLGTRLATSYARDRLMCGEVPYYSGVRDDNEASRRTALRAGFALCAERFSATLRRKD